MGVGDEHVVAVLMRSGAVDVILGVGGAADVSAPDVVTAGTKGIVTPPDVRTQVGFLVDVAGARLPHQETISRRGDDGLG